MFSQFVISLHLGRLRDINYESANFLKHAKSPHGACARFVLDALTFDGTRRALKTTTLDTGTVKDE